MSTLIRPLTSRSPRFEPATAHSDQEESALPVRAESEHAPANALGIRRIMFTGEGIADVVARLRSHGGELLGEIAQHEDRYRLCFMRDPEGIIIGLAEQLS